MRPLRNVIWRNWGWLITLEMTHSDQKRSRAGHRDQLSDLATTSAWLTRTQWLRDLPHRPSVEQRRVGWYAQLAIM